MHDDPIGLVPWLVWVVIPIGGGIGGVAKYLLHQYRPASFSLLRDVILGIVASYVGVLVLPFDLGKTISHNALLRLFGFSLLAGIAGKQMVERMRREFLEDQKTLAHRQYGERLNEFEKRLASQEEKKRRQRK